MKSSPAIYLSFITLLIQANILTQAFANTHFISNNNNYNNHNHPVYLIGQDDEGAGCNNIQRNNNTPVNPGIGCICVIGGDNKHNILNQDYTHCIKNNSSQKSSIYFKSELQCLMATRGCPECTPAKPFTFNSLKDCIQQAHKREYNDSQIMTIHI